MVLLPHFVKCTVVPGERLIWLTHLYVGDLGLDE
jgi:hypothetical protein